MPFSCRFCGADVAEPRAVYRASICARCGRDLRICLNCRFYSPGAHYDCAETVDEPVADKERANFCAFFAFREAKAPGAGSPGSPTDARRRLDKLFGDG